jgi:(p)ppGpp synthase/HD superfamily hydrolase
MSVLIEKAKKWAHEGHDSIFQKRKYTGEPYWVHTDGVADILEKAGESETVIAAGHLHDLIEDVFPVNPWYSEERMRKEFNDDITNLVIECTNVYTKEKCPQLNRVKRKVLEHKRLSLISNNGKSIKLADIQHNVKGIISQDIDFGKVFIAEKAHVLTVLRSGNEVLFRNANKAVADEIAELSKLRKT